MKAKSTDILTRNKVFVVLALVTGLILAVPLVAMQFTNEVNWDLFDFIVMGILLFGTGVISVYVARIIPRKYRVLVIILLAVGLLYIWAELAIGIFTNIGN
jgi:hypothetical protein